MNYQERNNLVALITNIGVMGYFTWRLWTMNGEGAFAGADALTVWAQTVIWVIPVSIVVTIVLTILATIGSAMATRDENPSTLVDERDRQIANRAMMTTMIVASAGFIGAIAALAFLGWTGFAAMNLIFYAFAAGAFIGNVATLMQYRMSA